MTTDQLIKSEQDGDVTVISFLQGAETINSTRPGATAGGASGGTSADDGAA